MFWNFHIFYLKGKCFDHLNDHLCWKSYLMPFSSPISPHLNHYCCLQVLQEYHGLLNRHQLMLEACELNSVSEEDYIDLGKAGLGSCLLAGLPHWLIAYSARLVCFCFELIIGYHCSFF